MAGNKEADVGICAYVTSTPPFEGILKHRYTDFMVNEVDLEGNTLVLGSDAVPAPLVNFGAKISSVSDEDIVAACEDFGKIAGDANQKILLDYLQAAKKAEVEDGDKGAVKPAVLEAITDKDARRQVHGFLKSDTRLPMMVSNTTSVPDASGAPQSTSRISVMLHSFLEFQPRDASSNSKGGGRKRGRGGGGADGFGASTWAGGDHDYVKFLMYKSNTDNNAAVQLLAKFSRSSAVSFGYAGSKDKRAVTTQAMTAYRISPERLAGLNSRMHGITLGNFSYTKEKLALGCLRGNSFRIVLRQLRAPEGQPPLDIGAVEAACAELKEKGFINYFGLQRFGAGAVATHVVGAALCRGDWKEAADLIMAARDDDKPDAAAAKALYREGNLKAASRKMPRHMVGEAALVQGLLRHGADNVVNALSALPRNLRTLYVHAFQSFLFNVAASRRCESLPADRAIEGDLVLLDPKKMAVLRRKAEEAGPGGLTLDARRDLLKAAADSARVDLRSSSDRVEAVHVVTAEEAEAEIFDISHVVLPIPGERVEYPKHAAAEAYEEAAEKHGVKLRERAHGVDDYGLPAQAGDYRYVRHVPHDLEYEVKRYSDPDVDLLKTDLEALREEMPPPEKKLRSKADGRAEPTEELTPPDGAPAASLTAVAASPSAAAGAMPQPTKEDGNGAKDDEAAACCEGPAAAARAEAESTAGAGAPAPGARAAADMPTALPPPPPALLALCLKFQLSSSSYATMLVRELTKTATDTAYHRGKSQAQACSNME